MVLLIVKLYTFVESYIFRMIAHWAFVTLLCIPVVIVTLNVLTASQSLRFISHCSALSPYVIQSRDKHSHTHIGGLAYFYDTPAFENASVLLWWSIQSANVSQ